MKQRTTQENIERVRKLAAKISKGNERALEDFFNEYWKFIFYLAKSVVHSEEDAKDILDLVLIKVWRNAGSLATMENPMGWLYTVTLNAARDSIVRRPTLPLKENIQSGDCFREMVDNDALFSYIGALSEAEQQVIICKFTRKMTFEEIAQTMDKPVSSVSSLYYRALPKIENKLKKLGVMRKK